MGAQAGAGRQCEQPAARRRRSAARRDDPRRAAAGGFVVARGRSGFAEPGAERRCGAGESRPGRAAVPAIEAAKADAPSVVKPRPPAPAPAKSKAVNDIPVTPLD